ncbi:MAG: efflux transporter periplasmic adaptor subunit, partial [Microvirgula sp.]
MKTGLRLAMLTVLLGCAAGAQAAPASDGRIRVQLMARHAVTLSGEIAAKIARLPVQEGGSFK